jgi:hypothetical protein
VLWFSLEQMEAAKNNLARARNLCGNEASVLAWVYVAELLDDLTIVFSSCLISFVSTFYAGDAKM